MRYMHTLEYYSAIKKNEILPFAATWLDPEKTAEWNKSEKSQKLHDIIYR